MGQSFILELHVDLAEYKTLEADGSIEAHRSRASPCSGTTAISYCSTLDNMSIQLSNWHFTGNGSHVDGSGDG